MSAPAMLKNLLVLGAILCSLSIAIALVIHAQRQALRTSPTTMTPATVPAHAQPLNMEAEPVPVDTQLLSTRAPLLPSSKDAVPLTIFTDPDMAPAVQGFGSEPRIIMVPKAMLATSKSLMPLELWQELHPNEPLPPRQQSLDTVTTPLLPTSKSAIAPDLWRQYQLTIPTTTAPDNVENTVP